MNNLWCHNCDYILIPALHLRNYHKDTLKLKHLFQNNSPPFLQNRLILPPIPILFLHKKKHLLKEMISFWWHDQDCVSIASVLHGEFNIRVLLNIYFKTSSPTHTSSCKNGQFYSKPPFCFWKKIMVVDGCRMMSNDANINTLFIRCFFLSHQNIIMWKN